jgi:multiple antibiotic resistance protein
MDSVFLIKVAGGLFAIMNPFSNLPVFLSLVDGQSDAEIRRTALAVTGLTAAMCSIIMVAGDTILGFFGISIDTFRLAGGLVLLLIGLGMLNGHDSTAHHGTGAEKAQHPDLGQVAFYPITFPILVGPGTIATLLVFQGQAEGAGQHLAIWVALAGCTALVGIVFAAAGRIGHLMSQTLRVIMTRLMGMILAAIAVGMMTDGLKVLLPGLSG